MERFKLKQVFEDLLGRKLKRADGISSEKIEDVENKLGLVLPNPLREFYQLVGNLDIFTKSFQRFAAIDDLLIKDSKLIFLEENQSVLYWAYNLEDSDTDDPLIYQNTHYDTGEWYSENMRLYSFLILMAYYQCAQGGYEWGASCELDALVEFQNIFFDDLKSHWQKVIDNNNLVIYWQKGALIWYFTDENNLPIDMIFLSVLKSHLFKKIVSQYPYLELL